MKVLVLGSGAREHAIAQKLLESPSCTSVFVAPGNALINKIFKSVPDITSVRDFKNIKKGVLEYGIDLVISGTEEPLVGGLYEYLKSDLDLAKLQVLGPNTMAAQLEGSKVFAKAFMGTHNIPTAKYKSFSVENVQEALEYIRVSKTPFVIKADGLAGGKGVIICQNLEAGRKAIEDILRNKKFGEAGKRIVVEEFLEGREVSVFIATDGQNYVYLPEAKDYKKIGVGDTGLNTGGMGAISPVPFLTPSFVDKIKSRIIERTLAGLRADGINYRGFLFFGIMQVGDDPYLLEYNIRLGDPEAECILPRIKSDFLELSLSMCCGDVSSYNLLVSALHSATIVIATKGYPENFERGCVISNIPASSDSIINYAGVDVAGGQIVNQSGRVLTITSLAKSLEEALANSTAAATQIDFDLKYFRTDIGKDVLP